MTLDLPGATSLTAEQVRERDARDAHDQLETSRNAAWVLMVLRHGCAGDKCRDPRHDADWDLLMDALHAIGARDDPEAQWERGLGYHKSTRRRRQIEARG